MKMTFGVLFVVLAASHMTATVSGLHCWTCKDASSNEECIAERVIEKCDSLITVCIKWNISVLNTTTGETGIRITQECGFPEFCENKKPECDRKNKTIKAPMKMLACNLTCCTSGPDCNNATSETTPTTTTTPATSMTSTSAPTTKLQGETTPTSPTVVQSTSTPTTKLQGACQFRQQPLMIIIAVIVSVLYKFPL